MTLPSPDSEPSERLTPVQILGCAALLVFLFGPLLSTLLDGGVANLFAIGAGVTLKPLLRALRRRDARAALRSGVPGALLLALALWAGPSGVTRAILLFALWSAASEVFGILDRLTEWSAPLFRRRSGR